MIGRHFGIDPIQVLDSGYTTWAIRAAAYRYSKAKEIEAEETRARAMNGGSRTRRTRRR